MYYNKHFTAFFEKMLREESIRPTHVCLYFSLFQLWNFNRYKNPISISREQLMRISKINSFATYHKCLKELHELGFIYYEPSYHPFKGSCVTMYGVDELIKTNSKKTIHNNLPK